MKIGDPIQLGDGTWGFIEQITSGIIEVRPFLRAMPYPRVVVIGVDRGVCAIGEEDEL